GCRGLSPDRVPARQGRLRAIDVLRPAETGHPALCTHAQAEETPRGSNASPTLDDYLERARLALKRWPPKNRRRLALRRAALTRSDDADRASGAASGVVAVQGPLAVPGKHVLHPLL